MQICMIEGKEYWLPSKLNDFQLKMYIHLIDWKWKHITNKRGTSGRYEYDAILPDRYADALKVVYPDIIPVIKDHQSKFPFRIHKFFNHMASSQAANINLFIPILTSESANEILRQLNPQFDRLAIEYLDQGWRIEFWDEPYGTLGDKTDVSGTDSDTGIAYYNHSGELCLWLIEHKLTEAEFTTCGGYRSKGRKQKHDCSLCFAEILKKKEACYYHDVRKFNYWDITEANQSFFTNHTTYESCPFVGGENQLWRNQLLAMAIEQDVRQPYKHAHFTVVKHPRNTALDATLDSYRNLIGNNASFTTISSEEIVDVVTTTEDPQMEHWIAWYKDLYDL
jgi:hypothetical protein